MRPADPLRAVFLAGIIFCLSGFDYSKRSISTGDIYDGGPPKDGIPALFDPQFIKAQEASFLDPRDRVLGIFIGGKARAYPINILNWHELINDKTDSREFLITYCPLCASGMAFDARIDGERFLFGVSGKLYNSDVLFYDKKTESLWSQIQMEAVTGPLTGRRLRPLPLQNTTWAAWRESYPDTEVLSRTTGYRRNYDRDPYAGYAKSREIYFPVPHNDRRLHPKELVAGISIGGRAKAYPFSTLGKEDSVIEDVVGGEAIVLYFDGNAQSVRVAGKDGRPVLVTRLYWFAWRAFHPETIIYGIDDR